MIFHRQRKVRTRLFAWLPIQFCTDKETTGIVWLEWCELVDGSEFTLRLRDGSVVHRYVE